jgi:two-component system, OmpR family, KDP operon response regulator KdpE
VTRVLIVDDEAQIRRALRLNLRAHDYDVVEAATGELAVQVAASERPDVVLLDLGLAGMDGVEVIEALRGWSNVPIVVLTVRDEEKSKVTALDAGADDYVTKPFGIEELLARLRAVVRRGTPDELADPVVTTPSFSLDLADRRGQRDGGEPVHLTRTEWAIVEHLVRHPDRLVTQRQLVDAVWGPTATPDTNLLRVHLNHIRRKLEHDPTRPRHFVTEPALGYRFHPD